jgi:hypothetical protein
MKTSYIHPTSELKRQKIRRFLSSNWLHHILPSAIVILILWLPFGFSLTGLIEEWWVLGLFISKGLFFIADSSSPLAPHALRPLTILPQALAYWLDNSSFNYWHVLLIVALLIKGSTISYLTEKLTGNLKLGIIASVLVLIYPADTMQLSFRALHINWALSLVLLGSVVFLHALSLKRKIYAYLSSSIGAALFSAACFMYEASLLLACIPILIIFAKAGLSATLVQIRQKAIQHVTWFSGALIYVVYVLHTAPLVKSYQSSITGSDALSILKLNYPKLFSVGLLRSTLGGWFDAAKITIQEFTDYWYISAATLCLIAAIVAILRFNRADTYDAPRFAALPLNARLALSGLLLLLLGYAPFLLSPAHLVINQRTFLFATPGAVLLLIAVLSTGYSLSKIITQLCVAFLFVTGLSFQLYQFHHYIEISRKQITILKDIADHLYGDLDNKTLLILDHGNQLDHTWMLIDEDLPGALSYLYNKPVKNTEVCHMPSGEWQHTDSLQRKGLCTEGAQDWTFHYPSSVSGPGVPATVQPENQVIKKSAIVTVEIGKENTDNATSESQVASAPLSTVEAPLPTYENIVNLLNMKQRFIRFRDATIDDEYIWTFGKWWSMELPIQGSGWREAEWEVNSFSHHASAWKSQGKSSLVFKFHPKDRVYALEGSFNLVISDVIKNSLVILINGTTVPFQWGESGKFHATIPQGILKNGSNVIEFNSSADEKYYGLSARMDGFSISRQP